MATIDIGKIKPVFKGTYDNSTAYVLDDIVYYNGSSYVAKTSTTGNLPTDATKWNVLASGSGGIYDSTLSLGTAGQVLKVNSGASALEFGSVEAILNIDGMTDGTGITVVDGDLLAISDSGTEKRITASQLKTYIGGYDGDITTIDIDGGTDIGEALADADLFIVDNGAGGTNRKAALSRLTTFMTGQGFVTDDPTALAIALG